MPTSPVYVFVLEPDGAYSQWVWATKDRVRQLAGDQLYLDHPPHVTLYVAALPSEVDLVEPVAQLAEVLPAPQAVMNHWHVFEADQLTGHQTLVCDVPEVSREPFRQVQQRLVQRLSTLRDAEASCQRYRGSWQRLSSTERANAEQFGFPFVGPIWHAHITIGSIRPADWPAVAPLLQDEPPAAPVSFNHLAVYLLEDGQMTLLKRFALQPTIEPDRDAFKTKIIEAIWRVVDRCDEVRSATIAGSFSTGVELEGISDIDTILVLDQLNTARFTQLELGFRDELEPVLAEAGYRLRINPTLGPLKFNDPQTAVLHLMLYSVEAHREHVVRSPFTCLDWQRSPLWRKARLQDVYPVFGLQPHHFLNARRGAKDYLADLAAGVVTYRQLQCDAASYREVRGQKPMTVRDRHEFAYHVMRFLMQNFLKLVERTNEAGEGEPLLAAYFVRFPDRAETFAPLFRELRRQKTTGRFTFEPDELNEQVTAFVESFERQFREAFFHRATRHLLCRHAPTRLNQPTGEARIFQGHTDVDLLDTTPEHLDALVQAVETLRPTQLYSSPLRRAVGSLGLVAQRVPGLPAPSIDPRLLELNCGACEGLSVGEARQRFPALFAAWQRREDPCFPEDGENTEAVFQRILSFVQERLTPAAGPTLTCTHNVVLRSLLGHLLGVPRQEWFRLRLPHLKPITLIATERFGLFVDLEEDTERGIFAGFLKP